MPIPKPSGEKQSEYISKCMSAISGEYPQDQALAICYNTYREENFRGINLVLGKLGDSMKRSWTRKEPMSTNTNMSVEVE
jgi:hypothetical protein